jgi:N-acetylglutamate synthase-like GNAT family acetyltransferase
VVNTVKIRKATCSDAPIIRKMVILAGLNPTRLDWRRFITAVDQDGNVVGFVQHKPHKDGSIELASLVVDEDWRGRGVGRTLIEALVADQDGPLYLMCRTELGEFYQKFGFEALILDQMPRHFRRIARLMGKRLLVMRRTGGNSG